MTKVIAFSGNSNTGKTSAMYSIRDYCAEHYPKQKVLILGETAREYIEKCGGEIDSQHNFQSYVFQKEIARLDRLREIKKTNEYDIVCVDRTTMDGMIYSFWNIISGELGALNFTANHFDIIAPSKELYDNVIFFSTPIKQDNCFDNYNNEHLNGVFEHSIKGFYGDRVLVYENNIIFQKDQKNIFNIIF